MTLNSLNLPLGSSNLNPSFKPGELHCDRPLLLTLRDVSKGALCSQTRRQSGKVALFLCLLLLKPFQHIYRSHIVTLPRLYRDCSSSLPKFAIPFFLSAVFLNQTHFCSKVLKTHRISWIWLIFASLLHIVHCSPVNERVPCTFETQ